MAGFEKASGYRNSAPACTADDDMIVPPRQAQSEEHESVCESPDASQEKNSEPAEPREIQHPIDVAIQMDAMRNKELAGMVKNTKRVEFLTAVIFFFIRTLPKESEK